MSVLFAGALPLVEHRLFTRADLTCGDRGPPEWVWGASFFFRECDFDTGDGLHVPADRFTTK